MSVVEVVVGDFPQCWTITADEEKLLTLSNWVTLQVLMPCSQLTHHALHEEPLSQTARKLLATKIKEKKKYKLYSVL